MHTCIHTYLLALEMHACIHKTVHACIQIVQSFIHVNGKKRPLESALVGGISGRNVGEEYQEGMSRGKCLDVHFFHPNKEHQWINYT